MSRELLAHTNQVPDRIVVRWTIGAVRERGFVFAVCPLGKISNPPCGRPWMMLIEPDVHLKMR
ncbi:MAG TPA: hypothetical protein VFB43_14790 [Terracidiphilus sp.]|nr:hypothetical protein [Terracidiphilus sp.]